ncbi:MFS transporter [Microbacterium paraoxydans]|uniref:MFS transporter n=1 Tax=Microbacterium paraoxydans TaxID=199592 RepID=UPI001CF9785F|nr:MFS transporter [Microbacterium paraoxydans]
MTAASVTAPARSTNSPRRIAAAQIIGTTIEWYDFFIFGTASALVFNTIFFPEFDPLTGTLFAFATFGVGLVARPLGGIIFGHIGDRIGRKTTLVVTLILMGVSTVAIGLLPTFDTVGIVAPILLVVLRIIQGISVGGEWGGAVLIGVEHASPSKKALFGSFAQLGSPIALVLSTLAFLAVSFGSPEWMHDWGWRIPFLASVILIPVGLYIRSRVSESHEFKEASKKPKPERLPILEVLHRSWKQLLIGVGVASGIFVTYYLFVTFVQAYAKNTLGMPQSISLPANIIAAVFEGGALMLGAWLSVKVGGRRIAIIGAAALVVCAIPSFMLVSTGEPWALYLATAVSMTALGLPYGVIAAEIALMFKTQVRYTGLSLSYNVSSALGGGLSPVLATLFLGWTGNLWGVAIMTLIVSVIMLLSCIALPKRDFSDDVQES